MFNVCYAESFGTGSLVAHNEVCGLASAFRQLLPPTVCMTSLAAGPASAPASCNYINGLLVL